MTLHFEKLKKEMEIELSNNTFYLPIRNEISSTYTIFKLDPQLDAVRKLFDKPPINTSTVTLNEFEATRITENKEKECQICGNGYKNGRHHQLFPHRNLCCICRLQYKTEAELVQHRNHFANAHICCKCKINLTGNQITDAKHFKECSSKKITKKGWFCKIHINSFFVSMSDANRLKITFRFLFTDE